VLSVSIFDKEVFQFALAAAKVLRKSNPYFSASKFLTAPSEIYWRNGYLG
jgi:hypothetical protein